MAKARTTHRSRQCAPKSVGMVGELPDPALGLGIACGDFCARLDREFCTAVCKLRCGKEMAFGWCDGRGSPAIFSLGSPAFLAFGKVTV